MKINIISDLHVDKGEYTFPFIKSDLLIIAGDISSVSKPEYIKLLQQIPQEQRTIIIMGNHEPLHYAHNLAEKKIRDTLIDFPHITLLENESIIIDDIKFLGTTLWSDFRSSGNEHYQANKEMVEKSLDFPNQYLWDEKNNTKIPVRGDFSESKTVIAQEFIKNELLKKETEKVVVITHFPPSKKSAETAYIGSNRSAYWVNSYDHLFNLKPDLWIHGHIHETKEYVVDGGTRVVCNPRGNVKKVVNKDFNPGFVVEI